MAYSDVDEWFAAQEDMVDCPLGARLRKSTCLKMQEKRNMYGLEDGYEHNLSELFQRCKKAGCSNFNERPRRKKKLKRKEQTKIYHGLNDIHFFNQRRNHD